MLKYQDFYFIVDGQPGKYSVEAQGPGEIRVPPTPFVFNQEADLNAQLESIKRGLAPSPEWAKAVGSALFRALFPSDLLRAFESARTVLGTEEELRIDLIVRPPELSNLPWELLYDTNEDVFLAARLTSPIVRYVESGKPAASLLSKRPLRVLYTQASPSDAPQLDVAANERGVREALGNVAEIKVLHDTTPAALRDTLREPPGFHILHYDGHGTFDDQSDTGYLALQDEAGKTALVSGEMLSTYLDGTSLRLVVLTACESGMDSKRKRFSGIAQQLMRSSKLPAVVAMQFEISDKSANAFAREFYKALVDNYPVDAAMIEGRKAILAGEGGQGMTAGASSEWATPVLYMRSKDGYIFGPDDLSSDIALSNDLSRRFDSIEQTIRSEFDDAATSNLIQVVREIEKFVAKGQDENTSPIERDLVYLKYKSKSVFDSVAECLTDPAAGVAPAISQIAEKVQGEGVWHTFLRYLQSNQIRILSVGAGTTLGTAAFGVIIAAVPLIIAAIAGFPIRNVALEYILLFAVQVLMGLIIGLSFALAQVVAQPGRPAFPVIVRVAAIILGFAFANAFVVGAATTSFSDFAPWVIGGLTGTGFAFANEIAMRFGLGSVRRAVTSGLGLAATLAVASLFTIALTSSNAPESIEAIRWRFAAGINPAVFSGFPDSLTARIGFVLTNALLGLLIGIGLSAGILVGEWLTRQLERARRAAISSSESEGVR